MKTYIYPFHYNHRRSSMRNCVARYGLVFLTFAITFCVLLLLIANVNLYSKHGADFSRANRMSMIQVTRIFPQGGESVEFDQPWTLPGIEIIEKLEDLDDSKRYLISNFSWSPGMGNLMFQYASLRAIAERYDAKLVVPVSCKLRRAFRMDSVFVSNELNDELIRRYSSKEHRFDSCCKYYEDEIGELFSNRNFEYISGYLQTYRYFHPQQEDLIRKEFTFLPEILKQADGYLQEAKFEKLHTEAAVVSGSNERDQVDIIEDIYAGRGYVYVGVHIRRGMDIALNSRNIKHGHTVVTKGYINSAMNYFRSKFEKPVFVISSDNPHWVETNINVTRKGEIFVVSSGYREVDLATLIRCNHTIMSTGTYSWWTAYLTNGTTIYYGNWPKPGSTLDKMIQKEDYFLDHWISME